MSKNQTLLLMKTLFDPMSQEWSNTNLQEKRQLLLKFFANDQIHVQKYANLKMAGELKVFPFIYGNLCLEDGLKLSYDQIQEAIKLKPQEDINDFNEDSLDFKPIVSIENFLMAIGLYLNKSFHPDFHFPIARHEVALTIGRFYDLKDNRTKFSRKIDEMIMSYFGGDTRQFFDLQSQEALETDSIQKRQLLKDCLQDDVQIIDLLFKHYWNYTQKKRHSIAEDAPYSAFALLWHDKNLLLQAV